MSKDLCSLNAGLLMSGIMMNYMITEEFNKMFGQNETPKKVVSEIMQGVMDGLLIHFDIKIDVLKADNKRLKEKVEILEEQKEEMEETIANLQEQIGELLVKKAKKKK